jgi:hypothetical protein
MGKNNVNGTRYAVARARAFAMALFCIVEVAEP